MCNEAWTLFGLCCLSILTNVYAIYELHKKELEISKLKSELTKTAKVWLTLKVK